MLRRYYSNEDIVDIIGSKEKQTPGRRYQIQMLMQNLVEFDSQDFLDAGKNILSAEQVRYCIKFVFFEVLNQLDNLDENIQIYIIRYCDDDIYGKHIINNVIYSRPQYIRLLRDCGILEKWFYMSEKKDIVFNLLLSIGPEYDKNDVIFIERHAFQLKEDDEKLSRCFGYDITQDTDEMFELRMKFYNKYPQMVDTYFDFKSMFKQCEIRTIRLLIFLLENKIKNKEKNIYRYEEEFLLEDSEILINNGIDVVDLLLPYIPVENDKMLVFSNWSGRYFHKQGLERVFIQIIKKANAAIINLDPEFFWNRYKGYMGQGNHLYNEIILDSLYRFPKLYSDEIIKYLCEDFESNIFEKTSGNGDELLLTKLVLDKHSRYCSQSVFDTLEETIIHYISPQAKDTYQRRIQCNRENQGYRVYWSFWGDLQKDILAVLPYNRLSNKAKNLLLILERKFSKETSIYKYSNGHCGSISSPIAGKDINNKKWLEILTNKKLTHRSSSRWREVQGGFIESSIEEFSRSFTSAVSKEPERMIKMILLNNDQILDSYIDSLFSGVAYSESIDDVPSELLEKMILRYPCDDTSYKANYICVLIEKRENVKWSQEILNILKDIAVNHKNPEISKPNVTNLEDKEMQSFNMLQSNALNCVRGSAAQAIAHLLWKDSSYFAQFKDTIARLASDENPAVKLASLYALWPSYNIDTEWASEKIIKLYEQDYKIAGFHGTKDMFFLLYPKYRQRILKIIRMLYKSDDKDLVQMGACCLSEMYILKNEFANEMNDVELMNETQANSVLQMVMLYFNKDQYNLLAKDIICKFKSSSLDLEIPISRLFYDNLIDLERDTEFLIEIMSSGLSRRAVHAFVHYLEEESKSVIDYKDIIISMSYNLIKDQNDKIEGIWGIGEELSKLIIGLYDETSESKQPELKRIAEECLDIWDLMFEKQIGSVRRLSQEMMER